MNEQAPMTEALQVRLVSIRCIELQEAVQDELYCVIHQYDTVGKSKQRVRLPEAGYWPIHAGETIYPDSVLLSYTRSAEPLIAGLVFKEEDMPSLSRHLFETLRKALPDFLPEMVDDLMGVLYVVWLPDQPLKWVYGLNTYDLNLDRTTEHRVNLLVPGEFHYELLFHLTFQLTQ
jgi:hypothetical protein